MTDKLSDGLRQLRDMLREYAELIELLAKDPPSNWWVQQANNALVLSSALITEAEALEAKQQSAAVDGEAVKSLIREALPSFGWPNPMNPFPGDVGNARYAESIGEGIFEAIGPYLARPLEQGDHITDKSKLVRAEKPHNCVGGRTDGYGGSTCPTCGQYFERDHSVQSHDMVKP